MVKWLVADRGAYLFTWFTCLLIKVLSENGRISLVFVRSAAGASELHCVDINACLYLFAIVLDTAIPPLVGDICFKDQITPTVPDFHFKIADPQQDSLSMEKLIIGVFVGGESIGHEKSDFRGHIYVFGEGVVTEKRMCRNQ